MQFNAALFAKAILLVFIIYGVYGAPKLKSGFQLSIIATGLNPTTMAISPDGRIFLCNKNGTLLVVKDDVLLQTPALSIPVDNFNERGLIGIALDPDFTSNNYIYLQYTPVDTPPRVSRFYMNGDIIDPNSETVLFEMDPLGQAGVHNGGALEFDYNNYLYIATGNIGINLNSQSLQSTWGKILRINKDGSIPTDNLFYNTAEDFNIIQGKYRAIWAYGLRNPFTMAMDPRTGKIFINEVGEASWEEINEVQKGANYGWPTFEGWAETADPLITQPAFTYFHQNRSCSITGSAIYWPVQNSSFIFPKEYEGKYFFGDYCAGWIRSIDLDQNNAPPFQVNDNQIFIAGLEAALGIRQAQDGSLYILDRGNSNGSTVINTEVNTGILYKVVYTADLAPSIFLQPQSVLASLTRAATFSVQVNGADPLAFQWYRNGVAIPSSNSNTLTINGVSIADNNTAIMVRVFNRHGEATSEPATLFVTTRQPPEVVIDAPRDGDTYAAGDTIRFNGHAMSPNDTRVDVTWSIVLHHEEHTHPFLGPISGVESGEFVVPAVGELDPVQWYRIYFWAQDSAQMRTESYVDIHPRLCTVQVTADTVDVTLELDGTTIVPPAEITGVVGMARTLVAPPLQVHGDTTHSFDYWSTGSVDKSLTLAFTEQDYSVTAVYSAELLSRAAELWKSLYLIVSLCLFNLIM